MLLVDHAQSHARRTHLLLNQSVGADDESHIGTLNSVKQSFFFFGRCRRGKQCRGDSQVVGEWLQIAIVLFGENLGRREPERLRAVLDGAQRCEPSDHGFSRAHVALNQALHGLFRRHVGFDFT